MPHSTTISTIGGTLLTLVTVTTSTIITTVIVAAIGAITSFFVSLMLKKIYNYITKKRTK